MNYHLILQGLNTELTQIQTLANMANARDITLIAPNVYRCSYVDFNTKETVSEYAFQAQLDATFIPENLQRDQFKLVAMDMDSTLITIECIDEIADLQGLKKQVSEITEAAMRGELDFTQSLQQRVALLKGLDESALANVYNTRLKLSPGAKEMLTYIQSFGIKTLLVSGGFTFFTNQLKQELNLDFTHANTLEIENGKLTGRVLGKIVDAEEKKETVIRTCNTLGINPKEAIVIGDGANDLKMMGIAGLSVAFRAKPIVRNATHVAFNFVGLDGLTHLF
jgi:phosphoserine phosphatase